MIVGPHIFGAKPVIDLKISINLKLSLRYTSFPTLFTNSVTLQFVAVVLFFAMMLKYC